MAKELGSILATDCGSTTTKAILIKKVEDEYRLVVRGEAPTTVEAPFDDVTKGVLNAVEEVEDLVHIRGEKDRYIIKDETYEKGLTYGAGHGGIESIFLVGLSVLSVGVVLLTSPEVLPPEQLEMILATPVFLPLVGVYERGMAMIAQMGFSLIVLESLRKKDLKFLLAAIGLHAALDFLAVSVVSKGIIYSEIIVTGFALGLGYWAFNKLSDEGVIG